MSDGLLDRKRTVTVLVAMAVATVVGGVVEKRVVVLKAVVAETEELHLPARVDRMEEAATVEAVELQARVRDSAGALALGNPRVEARHDRRRAHRLSHCYHYRLQRLATSHSIYC
jgi:hypothetical protein